jgi:hypothetical protein
MAYSKMLWAKARVVIWILNHGLKAVVNEEQNTPTVVLYWDTFLHPKKML